MDYNDYVKLTERGSGLVDAGEYPAAVKVFEFLVSSDISDLDKSMMCFNLALVHDKMGQTTTALRWYDKGIKYERPHCRFYVTEQKAAYLAQQGSKRESRSIYEELLARPFLTESDKERIRHNVKVLIDSPD